MEASACVLKADVVDKSGISYSMECLEAAYKQLQEVKIPITSDGELLMDVNPRYTLSEDAITFIGTAPTKLSRYNSVFGR